MPENRDYLFDNRDGQRTVIPTRLIEMIPKLPKSYQRLWPTCLMVYAELASQADGFQLGIKEIAKRTGLAIETVKKALKRLTTLNIIAKVGRKGHRNAYRFVEMKYWKIPEKTIVKVANDQPVINERC